jgi:endonuclease III
LNQARIVQLLKEKSEALRNQPRPQVVAFYGEEAVDRLLSDLDHLPHLFLLSCLADQQIRAQRASWIPVELGRLIGGHRFEDFAALRREDYQRLFQENRLHRFNEKMAGWYFAAIQRIGQEYGGDAARIWRDHPSSATVVRRFLRFEGVGIKIATMATNILAREFHVPMRDYAAIEISPDVHTRRVFYRLGLVHSAQDDNDLIYAAKELNPAYPGIFDYGAWSLGREFCKEGKPLCEGCYLRELCPKVGV